MRKVLFSLLLTFAVLAGPVTASAQAPNAMQDITSAIDTKSLQNMSKADWAKLGIGALAGAGVGYLLLEFGLVPPVELLGLTETALGPSVGAALGAVLTKMGYMDKVTQAVSK